MGGYVAALAPVHSRVEHSYLISPIEDGVTMQLSTRTYCYLKKKRKKRKPSSEVYNALFRLLLIIRTMILAISMLDVINRAGSIWPFEQGVPLLAILSGLL